MASSTQDAIEKILLEFGKHHGCEAYLDNDIAKDVLRIVLKKITGDGRKLCIVQELDYRQFQYKPIDSIIEVLRYMAKKLELEEQHPTQPEPKVISNPTHLKLYGKY